MNKLVVISGASGMSGNETVRQLLKKDYFVIGFDNFFASTIDSISDLINHERFSFFEYDLCNNAQMKVLEEFIVDYKVKNEITSLSFINFAAVVHTKHFYVPSDTFTVNVEGMRIFLDMAIRLGSYKFINCSTSEVYSMSSFKEGGVEETDPLLFVTAETSQRTSYAAGKLLTEFFIKEAVDKGLIKGCSIRFANVYSNDELMPVHIIPFAIDTLKKSNKITLLENAKYTYRTFLHNYDSCLSVITLMESEHALDGTIYNVGTQEEILIPNLVRLIGTKLGHNDVEIYYKGERSADPTRRLLSTKKIFEITGWVPRISLEEGIKMCIDFKNKL